jgi:hypothetical protein
MTAVMSPGNIAAVNGSIGARAVNANDPTRTLVSAEGGEDKSFEADRSGAMSASGNKGASVAIKGAVKI